MSHRPTLSALADQQAKHVYVYSEQDRALLEVPSPTCLRSANGPRIMDCSKFVTLCYKAAGLSDPNHQHYSPIGDVNSLIKHCFPIAQAAAEPGDLCFFGSSNTKPTDVNVYIGNGQSISMNSPGQPAQGPSAQMGSSAFLGWWRSDVVSQITAAPVTADTSQGFTIVRPAVITAPSFAPIPLNTPYGFTAINPAPGATWSRLDMGFDGNYGPAGVVAPYNGTISGIGITGWPGQGQYFAIRNDIQTGPDFTRAMYFAEGATPLYPNGTHVATGQTIGTSVQSGGNGTPGNFEIGPANTSNFDTLAKSYGLGSGGARQMVLSFYSWMRTIGAGTSTDLSNAGNT